MTKISKSWHGTIEQQLQDCYDESVKRGLEDWSTATSELLKQTLELIEARQKYTKVINDQYEAANHKVAYLEKTIEEMLAEEANDKANDKANDDDAAQIIVSWQWRAKAATGAKWNDCTELIYLQMQQQHDFHYETRRLVVANDI